MTEAAEAPVLHRMTRRRAPAVPDVPLTASRAVRLAVTRAAATAIGLTLTAQSVAEEVMTLDDLIDALSEEDLLVALEGADGPAGLLACDRGFVAAMGEVQTTGDVLARPVPERALTGADLSLARPLLHRLMEELAETTPRTALDGWADGTSIGQRFAEARRVAFHLKDGHFRLMRVSLDFGVEGRGGELLIALPVRDMTMPAPRPKAPALDWEKDFKAAVMGAPARLDAVLHKVQVPLSRITTLEIGDVISLAGCSVGSVRLVAPDGKTVARARLGQIAGQIAVRVQGEDTTPMIDLADRPAPAVRPALEAAGREAVEG